MMQMFKAIYSLLYSIPHKTAISVFDNVVVTQEDATWLVGLLVF